MCCVAELPPVVPPHALHDTALLIEARGLALHGYARHRLASKIVRKERRNRTQRGILSHLAIVVDSPAVWLAIRGAADGPDRARAQVADAHLREAVRGEDLRRIYRVARHAGRGELRTPAEQAARRCAAGGEATGPNR